MRMTARMLWVAALLPALGGCISVKTPEKPIEINLNVAIRQEVVIRLQRDVDQLIKSNPDVFPQAAPTGPTTVAPPATPAPRP